MAPTNMSANMSSKTSNEEIIREHILNYCKEFPAFNPETMDSLDINFIQQYILKSILSTDQLCEHYCGQSVAHKYNTFQAQQSMIINEIIDTLYSLKTHNMSFEEDTK